MKYENHKNAIIIYSLQNLANTQHLVDFENTCPAGMMNLSQKLNLE